MSEVSFSLSSSSFVLVLVLDPFVFSRTSTRDEDEDDFRWPSFYQFLAPLLITPSNTTGEKFRSLAGAPRVKLGSIRLLP